MLAVLAAANWVEGVTMAPDQRRGQLPLWWGRPEGCCLGVARGVARGEVQGVALGEVAAAWAAAEPAATVVAAAGEEER